ncbi:MAG: preprotein translocase subunit SecG [Candidatus Gygaella obscura]|nr:preprotein translocase subunit SecG [Candidatus Gygaella obscura]
MTQAILIGIYSVACLLLIFVILVQSGRGGGLVESFSGAESIFGTKTNSFLVKLTAILATIFLCSAILIAYLSKSSSKSLLDDYTSKSTTAVSESAEEASMEASEVEPLQDLEEDAVQEKNQ